ncbi:MAG: PhzF family phenazine biosynthesis protein [Candidatus Bipolaricaulota bacterium]
MTIPIYQVDAFAEKPFAGNPAAVCILERPADEAWMQSVAMEMNLSETAFVVRREDGDFDLRWFTPAVEVALCGHATLATSHILYDTGILNPNETARYHTKSGLLQACFVDGMIELDFPSTPPEDCETPHGLLDALGLESAIYVGQPRFDYLVEVESEDIVRTLTTDFAKLLFLGVRGVMVTAKSESEEFDFVSRFFAPSAGIDEDPVTGSAHCVLAPYWAAKLGKIKLSAYQASARGGRLKCTLAGDRVKLAGKAITVLHGELTV